MTNRQPAGIPTGGQFVASAQARSAVRLTLGSGPGSLDLAIADTGYGPMPQPDFTESGNGTYAHPGRHEKGRLAAALAQADSLHFPRSGASYEGLNTRFAMHAKRSLPELREQAFNRGVSPLAGPEPAEHAVGAEVTRLAWNDHAPTEDGFVAGAPYISQDSDGSEPYEVYPVSSSQGGPITGAWPTHNLRAENSTDRVPTNGDRSQNAVQAVARRGGAR